MVLIFRDFESQFSVRGFNNIFRKSLLFLVFTLENTLKFSACGGLWSIPADFLAILERVVFIFLSVGQMLGPWFCRGAVK